MILRGKTGLIALVLTALVIAAPVLYVLLWWSNAPYVGVFVEPGPDGDLTVTGIEPGSSAAFAGVQTGDVILAIGEVTAASVPRVQQGVSLRVIDRYHVGDEVVWSFVRDGRRIDRTVVFTGPPATLLLTHLISYAAFWAVGWFLLVVRPFDLRVRILLWAILANTAGQFYRPIILRSVGDPLGIILNELCAIGRALGPALALHFGAVFPVRSLSQRTERIVLGVAYCIPALLFLVEQYVLLRGALNPAAPFMLYGPWLERFFYNGIRYIVYVGWFLGAAVLMLRTLRRSTGRKERDQVKWVMGSTLFAASAEAMLAGVALNLGGLHLENLVQPYINLVYIVIAAGIMVAVLRHDLFDVDFVMRRTAIYVLTAGVLFVLFTTGENLLSDMFRELLPGQSGFVGTVLSGVIAAALFVPIRRVVDRVVQALVPGRPVHQALLPTDVGRTLL